MSIEDFIIKQLTPEIEKSMKYFEVYKRGIHIGYITPDNVQQWIKHVQ